MTNKAILKTTLYTMLVCIALKNPQSHAAALERFRETGPKKVIEIGDCEASFITIEAPLGENSFAYKITPVFQIRGSLRRNGESFLVIPKQIIGPLRIETEVKDSRRTDFREETDAILESFGKNDRPIVQIVDPGYFSGRNELPEIQRRVNQLAQTCERRRAELARQYQIPFIPRGKNFVLSGRIGPYLTATAAEKMKLSTILPELELRDCLQDSAAAERRSEEKQAELESDEDHTNPVEKAFWKLYLKEYSRQFTLVCKVLQHARADDIARTKQACRERGYSAEDFLRSIHSRVSKYPPSGEVADGFVRSFDLLAQRASEFCNFAEKMELPKESHSEGNPPNQPLQGSSGS